MLAKEPEDSLVRWGCATEPERCSGCDQSLSMKGVSDRELGSPCH